MSPESFREVSGASGGVGRVFPAAAEGSDAGGVVGWPFVTGAGDAILNERGGSVRNQSDLRPETRVE